MFFKDFVCGELRFYKILDDPRRDFYKLCKKTRNS